jgi:hypothetical protein
MAGNAQTNPDAEAKKWFTIAVVGAFLYVATVSAFVITRDVEPDNGGAEVQQHGQSD